MGVDRYFEMQDKRRQKLVDEEISEATKEINVQLEVANARIDELEKISRKLLDALLWCSASSDFINGGPFHDGWLRIAKPAIDKGCKIIPNKK